MQSQQRFCKRQHFLRWRQHFLYFHVFWFEPHFFAKSDFLILLSVFSLKIVLILHFWGLSRGSILIPKIVNIRISVRSVWTNYDNKMVVTSLESPEIFNEKYVCFPYIIPFLLTSAFCSTYGLKIPKMASRDVTWHRNSFLLVSKFEDICMCVWQKL